MKGITYLHINQIYHRDIKLENILLQKDNTGDLRVKIIDFGFSVWMAHD
jgi:serine/threonine protein kinase